MKNLEYLRTLDAEEMAEFLESFGAEMINFCDICPDVDKCGTGTDCRYTGRDDKLAWEIWLNSERQEAKR